MPTGMSLPEVPVGQGECVVPSALDVSKSLLDRGRLAALSLPQDGLYFGISFRL